jgi:hypothetical protein
LDDIFGGSRLGGLGRKDLGPAQSSSAPKATVPSFLAGKAFESDSDSDSAVSKSKGDDASKGKPTSAESAKQLVGDLLKSAVSR